MATSPVHVQGRYLWKDGRRFFVRGVVYQEHDSDDFSLGGRDLISDDRLGQLQHDIRLFQELGVNTIYIYTIDYTKAHAKAMELLEEANIYVIISLASTHHCIHRNNPYGSYTTKTLDAYFRTVDAMSSFANTLGALIADHLINNTDSERCAPVVRAVVRDVKKYMSLRHQAVGQRRLPVGFGGGSYKDDRKILDYLAAGDDDLRVDFWACTGFEWREKSIADVHGYDYLIDKYQGIDVPIFLSEYGNNARPHRTFSETTSLYSPGMMNVFSGGCVYELWQGSNRYGLASLKRDIPRSKRTTPKLGSVAETRENDLGTLLLFEDFANYKSQLDSTAGILESAEELPPAKQETTESPDSSLKDHKIEGVVPESCVDWIKIGEMMSRDIGLA